ncbi:MAG: o-succinylbenzoate--CoA ligase, partial [Rhodothermia bacterium]
TAKSHPNRPAIVTPARSFSYAHLDGAVAHVASGLREHGVESRTPVAAHLDDDWRYPVLLWALIRLGAPLVALNRREPVAKLREQAERAGCTLCISDTPNPGICKTELSWDSLSIGVATDPTIDPPLLSLSDPATIVFTSGSTGSAKGVLHTLGNHWFSAIGSQSVIPVDAGVGWLVALPFFHVGGLGILFRCFLHGGRVVLKDRLTVAGAIDMLNPTHVSLVPTQLLRLLDAGEAESISRLRCVLVGGARVPSFLIERARESGIRIRTTYGLTEMASQVTTTREGASLAELATSGCVLPFREVRLSADGVIEVRGRTLFAGYVDAGGLETPFDTDGWFTTGDVGRFDRNGRLTVLGRRDSMFISGGENVYPEEIEEAILNSGLVERAIVVPVEDREFGCRPVAFVSPLPDIEQLTNHLKSRIAGFKIPERFLELPPDCDGLKVDRARLSALANR